MKEFLKGLFSILTIAIFLVISAEMIENNYFITKIVSYVFFAFLFFCLIIQEDLRYANLSNLLQEENKFIGIKNIAVAIIKTFIGFTSLLGSIYFFNLVFKSVNMGIWIGVSICIAYLYWKIINEPREDQINDLKREIQILKAKEKK